MEIKKIVRDARRNYAFLEQNTEMEREMEYSSLIPLAEWFFKNYPEKTGEIVKENGDFYTSDREMESLALALLRAKPIPKYLAEKVAWLKDKYLLSICDAVEYAFRDYAPKGSAYREAWYNSDYKRTAPQIYILPAMINVLKEELA